jgi:hypothetical protein
LLWLHMDFVGSLSWQTSEEFFPALSLWTTWTSCVGVKYEKLEYGRFSWVHLFVVFMDILKRLI